MAVLEFARPRANAMPPILVCLDFDLGRRVPRRRQMIETAQTVLDVWRRRKLPVVHFRWLPRPSLLGSFRRGGKWTDGFQPKPGELLFDRPLPSAFSSAEFCRLVREAGASRLIVMGPQKAVLDTIAGAARHAMRVLVIYDTVVLRRSGNRRQVSDLLDPALAPSCQLLSAAEAVALAHSATEPESAR